MREILRLSAGLVTTAALSMTSKSSIAQGVRRDQAQPREG